MSDEVSAYKEWRRIKRAQIIAHRRELSEVEVQLSSAVIQEELLRHPALQQPRIIASYMSFAGEIDTVSINHMLRDMGHSMALPVVHPQEKGLMEFYHYVSDSELIRNSFKILEPDSRTARQVMPEEIEVMLVPLVGFNNKGDRLGMGGGYYDRMLKRISPQCLKLGLAHDFQLVEDLESQEWDMPLDEVITPSHFYRFTTR